MGKKVVNKKKKGFTLQKEKITKSAALRPSKAFFFFFSHITSTKEKTKTKTKKAGYSSSRKISSKARPYYAGTLHNKQETAGLNCKGARKYADLQGAAPRGNSRSFPILLVISAKFCACATLTRG